MTNTTDSTPQQLTDIRDMYVVHKVFRREFALIPRLVRAVDAGDTRTTLLPRTWWAGRRNRLIQAVTASDSLDAAQNQDGRLAAITQIAPAARGHCVPSEFVE